MHPERSNNQLKGQGQIGMGQKVPIPLDKQPCLWKAEATNLYMIFTDFSLNPCLFYPEIGANIVRRVIGLTDPHSFNYRP